MSISILGYGPPLVAASTVLSLFRALVPLAMLWVSKPIIDGVVAWISRGSGNLAGIWKLVAPELALGSPATFWGAPTRCATACWATAAISSFPRRTPERRKPDYLRLPGASAPSAKEVKIFGLGSYLSKHYDEVFAEICKYNKALIMCLAILGSTLNVVYPGGHYGAYVVVLGRTLAGAATLGSFTF